MERANFTSKTHIIQTQHFIHIMVTVERFTTTRLVEWGYSGNFTDQIDVQCDHDILLLGIYIWGTDKATEATYTVKEDILNQDSVSMHTESYTRPAARTLIPLKFSQPVALDKGAWYTIGALIKGPDSLCGVGPLNPVTHSSWCSI